jgi:hypothetical protein
MAQVYFLVNVEKDKNHAREKTPKSAIFYDN